MCVLRFEERPRKFNEGSAVRLIDALRNQNPKSPTEHQNRIKVWSWHENDDHQI